MRLSVTVPERIRESIVTVERFRYVRGVRSASYSFCLVGLGVLVCAACGDDETGSGGGPTTTSTTTTGATSSASTTSTTTSTTSGGMVTDDFTAGGDRPVTVKVPSSYDPATPTPLLVLLHGYSATGAIQDLYFGLTPVAEARGIVYAHPDGTTDTSGNQFWNATNACCDFGATGVDDVGYLLGLVDEISAKVNIDPKRIYFAGHSNGGFMSYRMACEASDRIAAIVSLAGAGYADAEACGASEPLSVLQIHGDMDATVLYAGGTLGAPHPSAAESTSYFAALAGCDAALTDGGAPLDLDSGLAGAETTVQTYANCSAGVDVELWTIIGGGHIPSLAPGFAEKLTDFLLAHPKP